MARYSILLEAEIDADNQKDAEKAAEGIADAAEARLLLVARSETLRIKEVRG